MSPLVLSYPSFHSITSHRGSAILNLKYSVGKNSYNNARSNLHSGLNISANPKQRQVLKEGPNKDVIENTCNEDNLQSELTTNNHHQSLPTIEDSQENQK